MKTLLKFAGIVACAAALGLNLQYAMDGYGIYSGKPYLLAFAAGNSSTTSSSNAPPKCGTKETYLYSKDICDPSTDPVKRIYESYFCYERSMGNDTTYKEGVHGTIVDECDAKNDVDFSTVKTKNC